MFRNNKNKNINFTWVKLLKSTFNSKIVCSKGCYNELVQTHNNNNII